MRLRSWTFWLVIGSITTACGNTPADGAPQDQRIRPGGAGGKSNSGTAGSQTGTVLNVAGTGLKANLGGAGGAPVVLCGNARLDSGEGCDDGNMTPGDGCDGVCRVETGYDCPDPGQPCRLAIVCGDRKTGGTEVCDDGNTTDGDGCSHDCSQVEVGYTCPALGGPCQLIVGTCGNAAMDPREECDDGNAASGDGCSANCRVEPGYVCPLLGKPRQSIEFCGDGKISYPRGETCDDGNTLPGDGCSESCHIEAGWICGTTAPSRCTYDVVCGDKRLTGSEACDDGNTQPSDGCSATCQLEAGYTCPIVGALCRPVCGDGRILGREQCDDGNTLPDDGCSASCQLETGWVCSNASAQATPCRRTVCGDGAKEGDESCDDGNAIPFDGCSSSCITEPRCGTYDSQGNPTSAVGACKSVCGDGILLRGTGEACDDGNVADGDGCSHDCQQEPGYVCVSSYDAPPPTLTIPVIFRDFAQYYAATATAAQIGNPDFGTSCCGNVTGIVQSLLGVDRKPVYSGTDTVFPGTTHGKTAFDQWYRDVPAINMTFYQSFTLARQANGVYSMNTDTDEPWFTRCGFYPLEDTPRLDANTGLPVTYTSDAYDHDNDPTTPMITRQCQAGRGWGFGEQWLAHNYLFTSELHYWFEYQGGELLTFSGDDDVWVFINGKLAVDLGGVHGRAVGTVALATGGDTTYALTLGQIYEVVVFQAERWCCGSNYWLTLSNFVAGRSTCTPVCGDGVVTGDEACDLGKDATGASRNTGEYGGCTPDCQLAPFCGDGIVNRSEECDDGSNSTPYGSQSGCARGCKRAPYCGDGRVDTSFGEVCDQGTGNLTSAYGTRTCKNNCQPGDFCGDGFKNGPEDCDDGPRNGTPGSRCDLSCQVHCGNGQLEPPEECDLGSSLNTGEYNGCRADCTRGPYCGDGYPDPPEQCDDGTNDGSYGTCNPDCTLGPYCGDGKEDGPEQCDLAANNQPNAYDFDQCSTQCLRAYCGDGRVQSPPEQCDGPVGCDNRCQVSGTQ